MANFTIKSLNAGGVPASTDMFIKSDTSGGLTRVTMSDIDAYVNPSQIVLTSSDDLNNLTTPGYYNTYGTAPSNAPTLKGTDWCHYEVHVNASRNMVRQICWGSNGKLATRFYQNSKWGRWCYYSGEFGNNWDLNTKTTYSFYTPNKDWFVSVLVLSGNGDLYLVNVQGLSMVNVTKITSNTTDTCTGAVEKVSSNNVDADTGMTEVTLTFSTKQQNGIKILGNFTNTYIQP